MLTPAELVWLLAVVAKGDEKAFERLYVATRAKLFGVVLRILKRRDLADEVMQETYLKIWNGAGQFDPAQSSPITWMVAIARNRAIDLLRKRTESSIEDEPEAVETAADAPHPLARREMTEELRRLLGCIGGLEPDRQRLVLDAYYNGWSREQLSVKLGVPVSTVKTWLRRSLIENSRVPGRMTDDRDHEERDALAAEYALGTLDADELARAEALRAADPAFAALVRGWERRLGGLNAMVEDVEPSPDLWEQIKARISGTEPRAPLRLPEVGGSSLSLAEQGVILLSRRLDRWRGAAAGCGALAAMLALFIVIAEFAPQLLPASLAPRAREVAAAPSGPFVAVLQKDGSAPAFVLTVNVDHRSLTVRRVDASPQPGETLPVMARLRPVPGAALARGA